MVTLLLCRQVQLVGLEFVNFYLMDKENFILVQGNEKVMKQTLIFGFLVFGLSSAFAQEVLTKTNGGASWEAPEYNEGIYTGDGTAPSDVDVTVTDHIDFDASTLFIDGTNNEVGIGENNPQSKLDVNGSISRSILVVNNVATNTFLNSNLCNVILNANTTVVLPQPVNANGRVYCIVNRTNSSRNISTYLGLNGSMVTSIPANSSLTVQSDGTAWYQIR